MRNDDKSKGEERRIEFRFVPVSGICLQPDRKRGIEMVINKNANVTVIPARYHAVSQEKDEGKPKLRVAAYCRVSTDSEEQATSYEAQIEHYTEYIQKNPEWELAGIFADEGLSGTDTRKRGEFNRRPGNAGREKSIWSLPNPSAVLQGTHWTA